MTDNGCKGCSSVPTHRHRIICQFSLILFRILLILDSYWIVCNILCIVLIFLLLYCNFSYKLCPQISMGFFKTIRLRLINKVFYLLKCSYPCGFTMWHFQHYPAERGSFDLTSPTRNEKTMTIVYSALPQVNSPDLLATMTVFLHPVIF